MLCPAGAKPRPRSEMYPVAKSKSALTPNKQTAQITRAVVLGGRLAKGRQYHLCIPHLRPHGRLTTRPASHFEREHFPPIAALCGSHANPCTEAAGFTAPLICRTAAPQRESVYTKGASYSLPSSPSMYEEDARCVAAVSAQRRDTIYLSSVIPSYCRERPASCPLGHRFGDA